MAKPHTLVHQIEDWAKQKPETNAIFEESDGGWKSLTWQEYWTAIRETAKGLISLGHEVGDCVAIVGDNRMDWVICQFGIMAARGIPAPIYSTNTDEQVAYIVSHSQANIAICDKALQWEKYRRNLESAAIELSHIVTMDDLGTGDERLMTLAALRQMGREQDDAELNKRLGDLTEDETALLIYTSGTTGVPKAVQLEHGGMLAVAGGILHNFPVYYDEVPFRLVSYLPLCHVAEQLFTNMLHLSTGGEVYFCPDLKQIKEYLTKVRPTMFLGVPRVWEKFQAALEARLGAATGIKAKLASWALKTELDCFYKGLKRGKPYTPLRRKIANKLVISKIKEALGLDQLVCAATGAAPISKSTLEFFASLGIIVYEGFGMSETTGVATCSSFGKPNFDSVGQALPGVEVKIAEDGEILMRGRIMTRGYLHMPEKTAELLDDENWLHTGDLGRLDDDGFLYITGRKKDIIITAGGKNVAPIEIESYLKQIHGVGQAVVVGDRQPYLCALLTLDPEAVSELQSNLGLSSLSLEELAQADELQSYLEKEVEEKCNSLLARYQTIKKFKVLPVEFSVEGGELTPTMKIKRNLVHKKYAEDIDAFYG